MTPPVEDIRPKARAPSVSCREVLTDETRLVLASIVRDEMRAAITEGIAAAMTPEAAERFWGVGLDVLQKQARASVGGFLADGLLAAGKKAMWVGVFALVVYSVGGWSLVKTAWAALMKG